MLRVAAAAARAHPVAASMPPMTTQLASIAMMATTQPRRIRSATPLHAKPAAIASRLMYCSFMD